MKRILLALFMLCLFVSGATAGVIDGMKGVHPQMRAYMSDSETQTFELPLVAGFIDGTGVMGNDGTTAPGIAETDDIPALVWASGESTKVQWTFQLPNNYEKGLSFRVIMSSDAATSTGQSIDWQLWVNDDGTAFDAAAIDQDAVSPTSATLSTKNEAVTLTIDATGETALSAGSSVTVDIWKAGNDNTTEIKGIQARYQIAK